MSGARAAQSVVVVFAGGDSTTGRLRAEIPRDAFVIAADSGLDHARAMGRPVDLVIGDLDSVSATGLAAARHAGAEVREYPADKDRTDLELALEAASERVPDRLVLVGGHGGRVDHFLANAMLLAAPAYQHMEIDALFGDARVHVVHGGRPRRSIGVRAGELCSVIAVHGPAEGVTVTGTQWELAAADLAAGSSRGVSNVASADVVEVEVSAGTVLVLLPGTPV
jgi:thiamine pyrophosphokinase